MNSIWNKNLKSLSQRFGNLLQLYENFTHCDEKTLQSPWNLITAKNGSLTGTDRDPSTNLKLHSTYNPEREAEQGAEKILEAGNRTVIFLGFGLGYHPLALAKKIIQNNLEDKIRLIILEPDPLRFFGALTLFDWSEIFKIHNLVLAIGCPVDSVIPLIENQKQINVGGEGISDSYFFTLPAFTAHAQNYFDTVQALIQRNKSKNEINSATYEKFAKLWARNSIKNLPELTNLSSLSDFLESNEYKRNFQQKQDYLLIAAGPSLEKLLSKIKELHKFMKIVCVETALRALLQIQVQPDFIVLTDPQFWAYKHIAALEAPESILVCPLSVYPGVFRFNCRKILLCSDLFPVSQFFENRLKPFGDLGAGGSVASSAWNLCRLLGAKRIFLGGLDLSFPTKQTHIRGSSAEETYFTLSNKIQSVDRFSCNALFSANPDYGVNYFNHKVLTDSRMKMFAWWFESRIAACQEIKTYSFCGESLKIPGVEFYDSELYLKEIILHSSPDSQNSVTSLLSTIEQDNSEETLLNNEKFIFYKEEFNKNIKELTSLINLGIEKCIINGPNLLQEIEKIQQEMSQNPLAEIIRLGTPSKKYLEKNPSNPPQLAVFTKLKKEISFYTF